jgi:molybdopterin biosynthesis enzyme
VIPGRPSSLFDEVFHPIAGRMVARCDAILRVGGASQGADDMVRIARAHGKTVFTRLRDVPGCESVAEPGQR